MKLKKIILFTLLIGLFVSLNGCRTAKLNSDEFDAYVERLPQSFIASDDMNLEYLFVNPQNYGFEETILNLPYSDESTYQETKDDTKKILKELEQFDYKQMNDDQKLIYDILVDNLERSLLTIDYYYMDNSYLGSFVSFQAQLPFLLDEYNFESKNDLESYFNLLKTSVDVFHKYVEIEQKRQENGVGMSKRILEKTIEQCDNFSNTNHPYLIDTINKKIDALNFFSDEEKVNAKLKNEDLLMNSLLVAYRNTKNELTDLLPTAIDDVGLSALPDGKKYYEALLKQKTGLDMSVSKVKKYLKNKQDDLMKKLQKMVLKNPSLMDKLDFKNIKYSNFNSVEETLNYLQTQIFQDFPKIDELNFKVSTVDESMKDNFSPAAYLQSRIDSPITAKEAIIINGEYSDSLFLTIAHEGYPGHMYQNVYFKSLQLPTVRYLLDYNGYSEGWATYVEGLSSKYALSSDKEMLSLYDLNTELVQINMCLFDIGIHYEGWNRNEFSKQLVELLGENSLSEEDINDQYDVFLETPTNYLQYYLTSFQFKDLQEKTEKELGTSYNPIEFHEVILKTGPASFHILEQQVDKYIDSKQ